MKTWIVRKYRIHGFNHVNARASTPPYKHPLRFHIDAIFLSYTLTLLYFNFFSSFKRPSIAEFTLRKLRGRSHDPSNRAGPLSGINFSCVHMVDIDWYVYLKVWKINYVIPSTPAHFNIFHHGRRDGVFTSENSSPLADISAASAADLA